MRTFAGKTAVITGAASGMGRALALDLAARGCNVALTDVNEVGLKQTAEDARTAGVEATAEVVDVADREAMHELADEVVRTHGQVDLVFNNAGVALSQTIEGSAYDDLDWIVGINFWGVVHGTKAFLPHLLERPEGHIVNTSSVFGLMAVPTQGAYNATKYAVRGFTDALRHELDGTNVSVTVVHPGGIRTNIARNARIVESPTGERDAQKVVELFDRLTITSAEKAAATIIRAVQKRKPRLLIGPDAYVADAVTRLLPARYWDVAGRVVQRLS